MADERSDDEELFEKIASEEEDKETDVASYKINTYGADYTLKGLSDKYGQNEIIIPPFQRKYVCRERVQNENRRNIYILEIYSSRQLQ